MISNEIPMNLLYKSLASFLILSVRVIICLIGILQSDPKKWFLRLLDERIQLNVCDKKRKRDRMV